MTTLVTTVPAEPGKLALLPPMALVVGSAIGGVFSLPRDMSAGAAPDAFVTGWLIRNGAISPFRDRRRGGERSLTETGPAARRRAVRRDLRKGSAELA